MKVAADSHHREVHFDVGDWLYVKLWSYQQTSLTPSYFKLSKRFNRPFAYCLTLTVEFRIHPVFHVSILKKH